MNDNQARPMSDAGILAAMKAVNPSLEKLMADRLALRDEVRQTKAQLAYLQDRAGDLGHFREILVPRYIAAAKATTLIAATVILIALATSLFTGLFETKTTASLFASLILPLGLVEIAERRFGRWVFHSGASFCPEFRHAGGATAG